MKALKALLLIVAIPLLAYGLAGDRLQDVADWPVVDWFSGAGKPIMAVVVRESSDMVRLSQSQINWLNNPQLAKDCKAAGIALHVIDPDVKDRDGNTPADLAAAIERAKAKGLPRLILIRPGGLIDYALPADEGSARLRIGIK